MQPRRFVNLNKVVRLQNRKIYLKKYLHLQDETLKDDLNNTVQYYLGLLVKLRTVYDKGIST